MRSSDGGFLVSGIDRGVDLPRHSRPTDSVVWPRGHDGGELRALRPALLPRSGGVLAGLGNKVLVLTDSGPEVAECV